MTDMTDDAIEWLNEIRCWINRCKDTEWGEDDQTIVDFITAAISAPKMQRVDLDALRRIHPIRDIANGIYSSRSYEVDGYNRAIDDIKSKYGDLYADVK